MAPLSIFNRYIQNSQTFAHGKRIHNKQSGNVEITENMAIRNPLAEQGISDITPMHNPSKFDSCEQFGRIHETRNVVSGPEGSFFSKDSGISRYLSSNPQQFGILVQYYCNLHRKTSTYSTWRTLDQVV